MSEPEQEQETPSVGQSELDLLIQIRDLLRQLIYAVNTIASGR